MRNLNKIVIIGAGAAGLTAAETLRRLGFGGKILMVHAENNQVLRKEKMKVIALRNRCIASGSCVLAASQIFTQRESDGVVELLQERPSLDLLKQVQQAVTACPAQVFVVEEEDDLSQLTLTTNDEEM